MDINPIRSGGHTPKRTELGKPAHSNDETIEKPNTLNPVDTPLSPETEERAALLKELANLSEQKFDVFLEDLYKDMAASLRVQMAELGRRGVEQIIVDSMERRNRIYNLLRRNVT
jgi:hypothetical protein